MPFNFLMTKAETLARICADRVIAIAQATSAEELNSLAQDLQQGGITLIELTLTIPALPEFMEQVIEKLPENSPITFGLGTVIDTETARRGLLAGASFISTPALRPEVILLCRRHQVPVICGVHSVSEIEAAVAAGADAIKLYPSNDRFGPTHVREIRAQFPDLRIFPIGGVTAGNAQDFIAAGADALFVASDLFPLDPDDPLHKIHLSTRAQNLGNALTSR